MQWTELVAIDPRLADLETAASVTLLADTDLRADDVYVMAKPYVAWLVGWKRGGPIRETHLPPPTGSALARFAATVLPFTAAPSPLDSQRAYTVACAHIQERLFHLDNVRAA